MTTTTITGIAIVHADSYELHQGEHEERLAVLEEFHSQCSECRRKGEGPICETCFDHLVEAGRITTTPAALSVDGVNHTFLDGEEIGEWTE